MTTQNRTCSTCVSFFLDEGCLNNVWFTMRNGSSTEDGKARPDDCCNDHMTIEEDEAENKAIALFWERIGIEPRTYPRI